MLHALGSALLGTGLLLLLLLAGPFRRGDRRALWTVPAVELLILLPLVTAAHRVHAVSGDLGEWYLSLTLPVLALIGLLLAPVRVGDAVGGAARP
jgi:hypothetical protein